MFAQSKRCHHQLSKDWTDALFALLNERPRDTIYSIAFYLSFVPLREGDAESSVAYNASGELFNLLDDYIRETDTLSMEELTRDRCFTIEDLRRANELYSARIKELGAMFDRYLRDNGVDENSNKTLDESSPVSRLSQLTVHESDEIRETFRHMDAAKPSRWLFLSSMNGVETTARLAQQLLVVSEESNAGEEYVSPSPSSSPSSMPLTLDTVSRVRGAVDFGARFTPFEAYLRYAPLKHRYDALRPLMAAVSNRRGVNLFPVFLPRGGVWQCGEAQLLWILLHTLAALSVARTNAYLARLFTVLNNLDFFIGCVECAHHWRRDRAREYLQFLADATVNRKDVGETTRRLLSASLPIDVLLAQCHNRINARNSRLRRGLTLWTVSQVVLDYREFVEIGLLRRRSNLYARTPPLPEATTTETRPADAERELFRVRCESDGELELRGDGAYRDGETLARLLWRSVDRRDSLPAGLRPM